MINYNELEKFYVGTIADIVENNGGKFIEIDVKTMHETLLYKLDDYHYADVNNKGVIAFLRKDNVVIKSSISTIIFKETLQQVKFKSEINSKSSLVKRLTFSPKNYKFNED